MGQGPRIKRAKWTKWSTGKKMWRGRGGVGERTKGNEHTCKKREIVEIYLRKFFWIFRKILGLEREINTAPKPSPEVAPSKMEVAPS